MMYNNNLAAAIKVNGQILREDKSKVILPFQSEYAILIKNLHASCRVAVQVIIDGTDVLYGHRLIIDPNESMELERFVKENDSGNRFKFIQRTAGIEAHRGINLTDGLIEIKFQFEAPRPVPRFIGQLNSPHRMFSHDTQFASRGAIPKGIDVSGASYSGREVMDSYSSPTASAAADPGITVPGSVSNQRFSTTTLGRMEPEIHGMVFELHGKVEDGRIIKSPVLVSDKRTCSSCGTTHPSSMKYCPNDGTSLEII